MVMRGYSFGVVTVVVLGVSALALASPAEPPVIPGLSRDGLGPHLRGLVLLGELGCASCHAAGPRAELIETKSGPDLSSVGARIHPEYLRAFVAHPRQVKPGTTMPDVFGTRDERTRRDAADALTHYLLSLGGESFSVQAPDRVAATQGRELFHSIGCVSIPGWYSSILTGALCLSFRTSCLVCVAQSPKGRLPEQLSTVLIRASSGQLAVLCRYHFYN